MKLLHLDSSILGPYSVSRQLSANIVAQLKQARPDVEVTYRDLGHSPVSHLSGATLMAAQNPGGDHDAAVKADLAEGGAVLQEFLQADTVVIGVAFYNFTVSSQLKAWVDRIVIAGQTFRYRADGSVEGLARTKRVILAIARGGIYSAGASTAFLEHAETYLRGVLGFMGINDIDVVVAEGIKIGPEQRDAAIAAAGKRIAALAA